MRCSRDIEIQKQPKTDEFFSVVAYFRNKCWLTFTAWKVSVFWVFLVRMRENTDHKKSGLRENTDQKNSEYGHFSRSVY